MNISFEDSNPLDLLDYWTVDDRVQTEVHPDAMIMPELLGLPDETPSHLDNIFTCQFDGEPPISFEIRLVDRDQRGKIYYVGPPTPLTTQERLFLLQFFGHSPPRRRFHLPPRQPEQSPDPHVHAYSHDVKETDILGGRGKNKRNNGGNKKMRLLARSFAPAYKNATSQLAKMKIRTEMILKLEEDGHRFLHYKKGWGWYRSSDKQKDEKVGHCIRDTFKNQIRAQGKGDDAPLAKEPTTKV